MTRRIVVEEPCEHGKWPNWLPHEIPCDCLTLKDHDHHGLCDLPSRTVLDGIPDEWVDRGAKTLGDNDGIDPVEWHYDLARAVLTAAVLEGPHETDE